MDFEKNTYYFFESGRPTFLAHTIQSLFEITNRISGKVFWVNDLGAKLGVGQFNYTKHPDQFMPYSRFEPYTFYLRPDYFMVIEDNHRLIATVPTLDAAHFAIQQQHTLLSYRIATLNTIAERTHEQALIEKQVQEENEQIATMESLKDYKGAIAL